MVAWRLKSGLQKWIGWVDICRYVVRGCVGRRRKRVGRVRFALRSAVVSDGRMPSSVSPPTRDARECSIRRPLGRRSGRARLRLGCFAAVRRVRRQPVSRAGAREVRGAKRHAGSPPSPDVSACCTAVRSGRSGLCSRIGNRWRLHAGRTDSQDTVQRAGRLRLVDGDRGVGGASAAQAFGEGRPRRVRRGLARFGLGRTGGDALRKASSSTATGKRIIARCVRCRRATCPDQKRFPAPETRKSG